MAPGGSAAGVVRSGFGACRDLRRWEGPNWIVLQNRTASPPGAGALPGARRRCVAGKRTHGPGTRACLALLALAAPAQAQTAVLISNIDQSVFSGATGWSIADVVKFRSATMGSFTGNFADDTSESRAVLIRVNGTVGGTNTAPTGAPVIAGTAQPVRS